MRRLTLLSAAILVPCVPAVAQSPGRAVSDALRSLTSGLGGCFSPPVSTEVTVQFFPEVKFVRGVCVREHGDSTSAIVGLDADSVLYLLSSESAFEFLTSRHPPTSVDGREVEFITVALELSGHVSAQTELLVDWDDLPAELRSAVDQTRAPFLLLGDEDVKQAVVHTLFHGYYEPVLARWELFLVWPTRISVLGTERIPPG